MYIEIFRKIFFPSLDRKQSEAVSAGYRFAHYTSAATATLILQNQELWLRSTEVMNDHTEVVHGARGMYRSLSTDTGEKFYRAINSCHENSSADLKQILNDRLPLMLTDTFISCLSEHKSEDDKLGRLSMWRAYGGDAGVAIVFRQAPLLSQSISTGAYTYPVMYGGDVNALAEIHQITNAISQNVELVKQMPREQFLNILIESLRNIAIATKHEAFLEEREWRLVACPTFLESKYLTHEVRCVGSISQVVQVLHIGKAAEDGITELSVNELIDRVLIGPTEYARVLYRSMVELLKKRGVQNAHERVHITDIPLRSNQR